MLVELSGSNAAHDGEKLDAYLEATMNAGVVADGTVARDSTQTAALWAIREGITGALALP
jgi:D-2-hydroxyglutarate dehydrogenase